MSTQRIDAKLAAPRRARRTVVAIVTVFTAMALAASAQASPEVAEFSVSSTSTQAGGHPDLGVRVKLSNPGQPEVAKDMLVNLPSGVFGNPGAIYKCRSADFALNQCAAGAQAGLVRLIANYEGESNLVLGTAPVYNMQTVSDDEAARFAFVAPTAGVPVTIPVTVRSASDYGLQLGVTGISQQISVGFAEFTIWGFPASPDNDVDRFRSGSPGNPPGCAGDLTTACNPAPYPPSGILLRPFIDNPSVCTDQPLSATLDVSSYRDPGNASHLVADYPETTGCDKQKFDPVLEVGLTTEEADAPSGLDILLKASQFLSGRAPAQSTLRSATLVLPEGLTINPDAADGQSACPDALAGFGTNDPGGCPDNSKIGTVEAVTPALDEPLEGSLFFGEPKPGDQYRVFMIFDGEGIHAKLFASVKPDPKTGRLTMSVIDLPQVPFEEFNLHLFASDRGLVATPTRCTIHQVDSSLVPWNDSLAPQRSRPNLSLTKGPNGSPCPGQVRPFSPRLVAGTSNAVAGDFSAFTLRLDRDDGDQFLGDLNFRMPPGFTGSLRGISYCPEASIAAAAQRLGKAEQASSSCPAPSQVGTTNVAAGPGHHPFHAVGKMYLAGPFEGAPLSMVAITPALAGPYDYGVVVVRVALQVDPLTAQVKAVSDTVPAIIGGVPIRMRSIQVNIDKPNFTINPTNCSPFSVDSQGIGDQGTVTGFSSYFQVVNCARLAFKPRMAVTQLGSRKETKRNANPRLRFDLFTRPGDANLKSLSVTLPKAFAIDQRHLGNLCSKAQLERERCKGRQPIGSVETTTPLLDEPLKGPAYAVSGYGILPHLAFVLDGQVSLIPQAESASVKIGKNDGFLQTVVPVIPDAPIGHFRLDLLGGKQGYLINTRNLCAGAANVQVAYTAQSGKTSTQKVKTKTPCGKARKAKRKSKRPGTPKTP